MMPRIFIGTMFSGEGDFDECVKMVAMQRDVHVTHKVITNLPEREAHNALWQSWREAKNTHDLFVKVDADTVLAGYNTLKTIWELMSSDVRITGLQAPLHDFFTLEMINGLNCFKPSVTFNDTSDDLFCDRRVDVGHDVVISSENVPDSLRPAGFHCYGTTPKQAFHFGLHRALKGQSNIIERVRRAHVNAGWSLKRQLVLEGASCAGIFADGSFNYTDDRFNEAFDATYKRINNT